MIGILKKKNKVNFYFDMDGVLADFDKGLNDHHMSDSVEKARTELYDFVTKNHPEIKRLHIDDIKPYLEGGSTELNALYKKVKDEVYSIADQRGFFSSLDPMSGAEKMLKYAHELTGNLPHILTAPMETPWCGPEKISWMKKHFDGLYDNVIVDKNKGAHAKSKNDILIDDRVKYTKKFIAGGGRTIFHTSVDNTLALMKIMGDL